MAELHQGARPWGVSGWCLISDNWKTLSSNMGRKCLKWNAGYNHVVKNVAEGDSATRGISLLGLDGVTCGINMHLLWQLFRSRVSHPLHLRKDSEELWCVITVHSRKGLGTEEEEGSMPPGHSGAPFPRTETSGSSAFGMGQFLGGQCCAMTPHFTIIVASTQEDFSRESHSLQYKCREPGVQPREHRRFRKY